MEGRSLLGREARNIALWRLGPGALDRMAGKRRCGPSRHFSPRLLRPGAESRAHRVVELTSSHALLRLGDHDINDRAPAFVALALLDRGAVRLIDDVDLDSSPAACHAPQHVIRNDLGAAPQIDELGSLLTDDREAAWRR